MDWDDLRYFVVLAREGSLSAAARRLGTEHTTVARRVQALENRLGVRLFERAARGYAPTPQGERIAELAFRVEEEMFGIERLAEAGNGAMSGVVRIAAPPAFAGHYLAHRLARLREREPGLIIELAGDPRAVSLSRREADIAVRLNRPEPGAVVARQIGSLAFGLYGARDYLERLAPDQRDYIGYDESLDHVAQQRWLTALAEDRPLVFRSNELDCLHQATVAGFGLAALPRFMGDADARLTRVETSLEAPRRGLWLLVHPDLRRSPRVRLALDFIAEAVRQDRAVLDPP